MNLTLNESEFDTLLRAVISRRDHYDQLVKSFDEQPQPLSTTDQRARDMYFDEYYALTQIKLKLLESIGAKTTGP